ncbi:hypothetical protein CsSME_00019030 [Camellia sinensis var. sinensis]
MGSSFYLHVFMLLCCCFHLFIILTNSSSSAQPLCHEDESSSLLQFKHSFFINKSASDDPLAYPKVESWKKLEGKSSDCCSWDGVECDHDTGHVIGLNLSSSWLYGSINSNSSLFNLVHLQRLNLADNHFNYSQIPPRIGSLSRLTSLDLYYSAFFGQIPSNMSHLSNLAYLDLSRNTLKLGKPNLEDLVQNLTNLKALDLSLVNISSTVTRALSNMSLLTTLSLKSCQLYGEFPTFIFQLPNLQILKLANNVNLSGMVPDSIGNLESISYLDLSGCNFSGMLPASLGSVTKLTYLDLSSNQFWGQIPEWLGNLSQLTDLSLDENNFDVPTLPLTLGKLSKLTYLSAADMKIRGEIPQVLANLTQLSSLFIRSNELVGQIPSWLMNLTKLTVLDLGRNQLHGMIPSSISQLKHLVYLNFARNNLSGKVELDIFLKLQNLLHLGLSKNNLMVFTKNITNATLPKFIILGLESCNMKEFPNFLQFQVDLRWLLLADNKIQGEIPTWFWNNTKESMEVVDLPNNFLTGFEQHPDVIPWRSLICLDLSFNRLQGSLPIPPPSTNVYRVASNSLSGEIPPSIICHNRFLQILDLSDNNLSGMIPQCLFDFSDSLLVLNLSLNNFQGTIPHMMGINLMMIDLSQNHLHGLVPRSLQNCTSLEILVLGNNQIEDTFPSWLGALPMLQVLILRSNRFHGAINVSQAKLKFAKLRIIDLSDNSFSGNLPSEYFQNWNAMAMVGREKLTYMQADQRVVGTTKAGSITIYIVVPPYMYSVTMDNKGTHRLYEKIQKAIVAVDLSNNKFRGEIPESLGRLSGLQMINLSNNNLTGVIPSSLGNLAELESLDLSRNLLSGEIPQQLSQLTFLEFLNVSHNHLTGHIPQGNQFDTFENNSYDGNSGLCGYPLSKLCGNSEASPPPSLSFHGDDSKFPSGVIDWIIISLGYGSGLIVGLVIGHILTTRYHEWFVEKFGTRKQTQKRVQRKGRRN